MVELKSNVDAVLVAIPMVGIMITAIFRLDELFSRPQSPVAPGHSLSHWDEDGQLVCIEPDGGLLRKGSMAASRPDEAVRSQPVPSDSASRRLTSRQRMVR